jgi:hypothetical protein
VGGEKVIKGDQDEGIKKMPAQGREKPAEKAAEAVTS